MKKIISLFILIIVFFVGFAHNSMMIFATESSTNINNELCCSLENDNKKCSDNCCIQTNEDYNIFTVNNFFNNKIIKTYYYYKYINSYKYVSYLFNNKKQIFKNLEPNNNLYTPNSYHALIKIIKSNT